MGFVGPTEPGSRRRAWQGDTPRKKGPLAQVGTGVEVPEEEVGRGWRGGPEVVKGGTPTGPGSEGEGTGGRHDIRGRTVGLKPGVRGWTCHHSVLVSE